MVLIDMMATKLDASRFLAEIDENGFCVLERVVPESLIAQLKGDLEKAIEKEASSHGSTQYQDYGMILFCPIYGSSFLELLALDDFIKPIETLLGEHCIVYSYTSSSMPPNKANYSMRIHNDCSIHMPPDYITRLGALITLDDFTPENGSTWVLPGSHKRKDPPTESEFYAQAIRINIPMGSVWYAHPKVWHSGGLNHTGQWRHAITIGFCKAYMKQRMDIPRMMQTLQPDFKHENKKVIQKLGFYAQVPTSYEEYYAPPELRKFRQPAE